MEKNKLAGAVEEYIEESINDIHQYMTIKQQEHAFWPLSKKNKQAQIDYLSKVNEDLGALVKIDSKTNLPKALNKLFVALVNAIPSQVSDYSGWFETVYIVRKLIRRFVSQLVANHVDLYAEYGDHWIDLCHKKKVEIPFIQLNIIGLFDHIDLNEGNQVKQYLIRLNMVDWATVFEDVFTKKAILDRLFNIATLFIHQAGSVDKLKHYLQKQLHSAPALLSLINLYQAYLNGIQRKLDIYRMIYPEFSFDSKTHPVRQDVSLAKQRHDVIQAFLTELKN